MSTILQNKVAPAKSIVYENIPLIGGQFDGSRVSLKNCSPTISYCSKKDPEVPIVYRRLDLDDGNGNKTILYIDNEMGDMDAFSLLVKGYRQSKPIIITSLD
jgi:hypothetical protein